ncbi:MAG: response regulator [Pseudobdellovibrionaceae bacterium]|nr:response regulator [Bdellovibrionales bacterium]USN46211.1 MAG: response regulator [Pseudobdellovibrionaceae bacterium]
MRILLAEDDMNISTIAKLALEHIGGHTVDLATDGEAALEKALHGTYDLILLDEMMPKKNGIAVCQEYLAQKQSPTPVIFMSANTQESSVTAFHQLGVGHIPKPFDPATLNQQIAELLRKGSRKAA